MDYVNAAKQMVKNKINSMADSSTLGRLYQAGQAAAGDRRIDALARGSKGDVAPVARPAPEGKSNGDGGKAEQLRKQLMGLRGEIKASLTRLGPQSKDVLRDLLSKFDAPVRSELTKYLGV